MDYTEKLINQFNNHKFTPDQPFEYIEMLYKLLYVKYNNYVTKIEIYPAIEIFFDNDENCIFNIQIDHVICVDLCSQANVQLMNKEGCCIINFRCETYDDIIKNIKYLEETYFK